MAPKTCGRPGAFEPWDQLLSLTGLDVLSASSYAKVPLLSFPSATTAGSPGTSTQLLKCLLSTYYDLSLNSDPTEPPPLLLLTHLLHANLNHILVDG